MIGVDNSHNSLELILWPIRCKTQTSSDLVTRVSRAFGSLRGFSLSFDWLVLFTFFSWLVVAIALDLVFTKNPTKEH